MAGAYAMRVRIRFSKTGALVYIGHLDVMRYFQKLFRRSGIPVKYSEGFSPHQILSFSDPLPLGMESIGEYAEVELTERISTSEALTNLRSQSVPEIEIMSFKELDDGCENAMASVRAARYSLVFKEKTAQEKIRNAIDRFCCEDVVTVTKKTKKNETEINLRPLVYELKFTDDDCLEMLISSGSRDNIKPALVINALCAYTDPAVADDDYTVKRIDQYTMINDEIISLDDIGRELK